MSKLNIKRTVENNRANTTVYSRIVEVVVNALQAIERSGRPDGKIAVRQSVHCRHKRRATLLHGHDGMRAGSKSRVGAK